jgi:glycosyltransferase involved in cell wall biosynthesis
MTRIAYVSADPGVPVFGSKGCSVHVQEVIRAMVAHGAQVDLFPVRLGGPPPRGFESVSVQPIELDRAVPDLEAREQECLAAGERIAAALEEKPDYDLVYERYSLWSAAGMEFASQRSIPGVLEVNAPLIDEQAAHRGLVDRKAAEALATRSFGAATVLSAVSHGVADYLEGFGVARERIHVIPNGVDPARFGAPLGEAAGDGTFTVGFLGTLKPWHDLDTLAKAFRSLHAGAQNARLLIVGDGPEREKLADRMSRWGIGDAVHFTGLVHPDEIPGWLARMDVGVAPYGQGAGFYFSPLKVLEYMAASLPTVASRIGELPEWIVPGQTGLLYEPGNADELCDALEQLRKAPALRADLGLQARGRVESEHTWAGVVSRVLAEAGLATGAATVPRVVAS